MNWDDMLLGRDDRYSPAEWEAYKDHETTNAEMDLAMGMEDCPSGACANCGHAEHLHFDRYGCQHEMGDTLDGSRALPPCGCNEFRPNCPGGNDEEGGKAVSARPARMTCCEWMRKTRWVA